MSNTAPAGELTDAQIDALLVDHGKGDDGFHGFARAIIAADQAQRQAEPACPTCGETEPFAGSCGTGSDDARLVPTAPASRDAESLREICRVSSCLAESWPDLETDTMIVRHFKWMARYINATPPRTDVLKAVDELLTVSATAFGTGVDDPHRHYQDQLKALRSARADDLARHPPAAPDPSFQLCGECGHRGLPSRIGKCRRCGRDALELITAPASKPVQP